MKEKKLYTIGQGIDYAMNYCSKEERCQKDLKDKLLLYGMSIVETDSIIAEMISQGFVNEQRYAELYTRSKINQNHWGRIKIKYMLSLKQISKPCIDKAFQGIDENKYLGVAKETLMKKNRLIHTDDEYERKMKLFQYMSSHGFENDIINNVLKELGL